MDFGDIGATIFVGVIALFTAVNILLELKETNWKGRALGMILILLFIGLVVSGGTGGDSGYVETCTRRGACW